MATSRDLLRQIFQLNKICNDEERFFCCEYVQVKTSTGTARYAWQDSSGHLIALSFELFCCQSITPDWLHYEIHSCTIMGMNYSGGDYVHNFKALTKIDQISIPVSIKFKDYDHDVTLAFDYKLSRNCSDPLLLITMICFALEQNGIDYKDETPILERYEQTIFDIGFSIKLMCELEQPQLLKTAYKLCLKSQALQDLFFKECENALGVNDTMNAYLLSYTNHVTHENGVEL